MRKLRYLLIVLALVCVLAGCGETTTIIYEPAAPLSTATPVPTATQVMQTAPQSAKAGNAPTVVYHLYLHLGQSCTNCGGAWVHAPWKLAYRCADLHDVAPDNMPAPWGMFFELSSSNGTSGPSHSEPPGCTDGKVWLSDYSDTPTVGSGAYLSIDSADCGDPTAYGGKARIAGCDIWLYQA